MSDITFGDIAKAVAGPCIAATVSFIGVLISGTVAYLVSIRTTRTQRRLSIDTMQNKAIELAMQYPHLERDEYCNAWPTPPGDPATKEYKDEKDRYDNYCCYLFNMIRQAWEYSGKKINDLDDMLAFREYIIRHSCWWKHEDDNTHYYAQEFINFVNGIIADAKRKEACK